MSDLIFQLHSPEEFRYLSSLGHWIAGYIFFGVTVIAFLQALGFLKKHIYLWPLLVVIAGIIFIPYNLLHHGIEKIPLVWKVIELDPQQRQHFIMFNILFGAGFVELLVSLKWIQGKLWYLVWPMVIIIVGLMFLFHPQHGTEQALAYSIPYHRILGSVLIISGILKALQAFWLQKYKLLTFGWILFLFIASIMLISFNEPEGSYMRDSKDQSQIQHSLD